MYMNVPKDIVIDQSQKRTSTPASSRTWPRGRGRLLNIERKEAQAAAEELFQKERGFHREINQRPVTPTGRYRM